MRDFKVGDFVKPINDFVRLRNETLEIIDISISSNDRILIMYHNKTNMNGTFVRSWESADEYELDIEKMREIKLNELGI